jgi:hypothetical protein
MATLRSTTTTNTGTTVSTTGVDVIGLNIVNRHNAVIYVRFYDQSVATFQDTPIFTVTVPASGANYVFKRQSMAAVLFSASRGLYMRVSTDTSDNGNTAAGTLPIIEIEYH